MAGVCEKNPKCPPRYRGVRADRQPSYPPADVPSTASDRPPACPHPQCAHRPCNADTHLPAALDPAPCSSQTVRDPVSTRRCPPPPRLPRSQAPLPRRPSGPMAVNLWRTATRLAPRIACCPATGWDAPLWPAGGPVSHDSACGRPALLRRGTPQSTSPPFAAMSAEVVVSGKGRPVTGTGSWTSPVSVMGTSGADERKGTAARPKPSAGNTASGGRPHENQWIAQKSNDESCVLPRRVIHIARLFGGSGQSSGIPRRESAEEGEACLRLQNGNAASRASEPGLSLRRQNRKNNCRPPAHSDLCRAPAGE